MPRNPALVLSLLVGVAGCASPGGGRVPDPLVDAPEADSELTRRLDRARDQRLRGESAEALRAVEALLVRHPNHVNSERLRQDLLRQRGRVGLVLYESEARVSSRPESAASHYLQGRVADLAEDKRASFLRAVELQPENFWGWFGLAFSLRDENNDAANEIYRQLFERSRTMRVGVAYATSLSRGGHEGAATQVYEQLRKDHPGVSALGQGEALLRAGKHKQAWPFVRIALEHRPFDGGVHALVASMLAQGIPQDGVDELLDVLRSDPARMRDFSGTSPRLLAEMFQRVGEPEAALRVLRESRRHSVAEVRTYQLLRLTCEGVRAYLAELAEDVMPAFLADEGNQVRDRWQTLVAGPWMKRADPIAELAEAVDLVRALAAVGRLQAADVVANKILLRHSGSESGLPELQDEIRREIAFEAGLRRVLTRGYLRYLQDGTTGTLAATFEELRDLAKRTLGRDVVGSPKLFELPFVGTLVDSLGPGLPEHLAKYNKHLVMGQRVDRPTEGMILTRLSMRYVDPVAEVPLPPRCVEVVGEHRELEPFEQGDLAGIALLNHYVVDMDEVRSWASSIVERRRIAAEDGRAVLADPLPRSVVPGAPVGVEWRLALLSPVEDSGLDEAVLDIIRWHERGHMVDFHRLLPVELHPIRALALTLRNGLNSLAVASEMEGRAELVALAMSPHTRLVAAHISGFLAGEGGGSPHAHGFRDLTAAILEGLRERGVARPEVRYWHQLDPKVLRAVGKDLLTELW